MIRIILLVIIVLYSFIILALTIFSIDIVGNDIEIEGNLTEEGIIKMDMDKQEMKIIVKLEELNFDKIVEIFYLILSNELVMVFIGLFILFTFIYTILGINI